MSVLFDESHGLVVEERNDYRTARVVDNVSLISRVAFPNCIY
jgi:hypothetical protein